MKLSQLWRLPFSWLVTLCACKVVFIATQLNWTQLTQLNSVQPSQSCFCLWRHDLQTESTGSLRSLIGDSCSRCERVDNSTLCWVELSCIGVAIDTSPTQLNSTSSWVELCRYKRAFKTWVEFSCVAINGPLNVRKVSNVNPWICIAHHCEHASDLLPLPILRHWSPFN